MQMNHFINTNMLYILIGLVSFSLILFLILLINIISVSRLKKRLNNLLGNHNDKSSLENLICDFMSKVDKVDEKYDFIVKQTEVISSKMNFCIQKVGLIRYNALGDVGGDLCFALALLDDKNDGIVINSIYTQESSYFYGKKITNKKCDNQLSEEEIKAINMAIDLAWNN